MKRLVIFILLFCTLQCAYSERSLSLSKGPSTFNETQNQYDFNSWLENYAFDTEDETSREELLELWNEKSTEKLNLNTATREELEEFSFLSSKQIENLLEYRFDYKEFLSIYELTLIDGWDSKTVEMFYPFVEVKPKDEDKFSLKKSFQNADHQLINRVDYTIQEKKGFKENKYLGDPIAGYLKYKLTEKNISLGVTMEKDAGEPFDFKNNQGFDFYSAHFMINNLWKFKTIILGDFKMNFGQGLVFNSNAFYGTAASVEQFIQRIDKINKYTSNTETNFFRGIATTMEFDKLNISLFGSFNYLDSANGYHRTENEIKKKFSGYKFATGGNINYRFNFGKIGLSAVYDSTNLNFGLDYRFHIKNYGLAGEVAVDKKGNIATLHNFYFSTEHNISSNIMIRYYGKGYSSSFANAYSFKENSGETGILWAFLWNINEHWKWYNSADFAFLLDEKYLISKPSVGYKINTHFSYNIAENHLLNIKYSFNSAEKDDTDSKEHIRPTHAFFKHSVQVIYNGNFINGAVFKSGVLYNYYKYGNEKGSSGYLLYQDFGWKWSKINFILRLAFFDAESYENRLYSYENDVLYAFSSNQYNGKGIRFFFNFNYKIFKNLQLCFKVSNTFYLDRNVIGSGNEEISGPNKTDFHILLNWKW